MSDLQQRVWEAHKLWEYDYVLRHTRNLENLVRLNQIQLYNQGQVEALYSDLMDIDDRLTFPSRLIVHGRRSNSSGLYQWGQNIRLGKHPVAEVAVHELAHHATWTITCKGRHYWRQKYGVRPHGFEFVAWLDRMADAALTSLGWGFD